jgi:ubiquinone/menaquinone biosynthesis C-methylase UbiE
MVESKGWNWDNVSDDYWGYPSEDIYYYLIKWANLNYKTFLDLGCGIGRHSIFFAKKEFDVYSFDLSKNGLKILEKRALDEHLNINIKQGDMLSLPYENNYFDCILAYHSIYHTDTCGLKTTISEIYRVLKSNGEAFLTFISKNSNYFRNNYDNKVDENTIIKKEEDESDIPHCYVDLQDLQLLLNSFTIKKVRQIEDIWNGNNSWHYYVNIRKC